MPDPTEPTDLPPAFFRALAFNMLDNIRGGAPREEVETYIAGILKDTFESGMASTLTAVVTGIEAVRVPPNGMVLFKVPAGMPDAQVAVFRRDLGAISGLLERRLGCKPILLAVPDEVAVQAIEFDGPDAPLAVEVPGEGGELVDFPGMPKPTPVRRIVALDPLKLRDRVIDVLPDDLVGTVTVLPMSGSVIGGVMHHDIRIVLPKDPQLLAVNGGRTVVAADRVADLENVVEAFATETRAHFKVTVLLADEPARDDSPTFAVAPAAE